MCIGCWQGVLLYLLLFKVKINRYFNIIFILLLDPNYKEFKSKSSN